MGYEKKPKRQLVVESYYRASALHVRPMPGQWCSPNLNVSCAREMEDPGRYPTGTKFLVDAHSTSKEYTGDYIYADRNTFKAISDDEAANLIVEIAEQHKLELARLESIRKRLAATRRKSK